MHAFILLSSAPRLFNVPTDHFHSLFILILSPNTKPSHRSHNSSVFFLSLLSLLFSALWKGISNKEWKMDKIDYLENLLKLHVPLSVRKNPLFLQLIISLGLVSQKDTVWVQEKEHSLCKSLQMAESHQFKALPHLQFCFHILYVWSYFFWLIF